MRGKAYRGAILAAPVRITPAHAGKSDRADLFNLLNQDHPRTCGEKESDNPLFQFFMGSPPHMRGKD